MKSLLLYYMVKIGSVKWIVAGFLQGAGGCCGICTGMAVTGCVIPTIDKGGELGIISQQIPPL